MARPYRLIDTNSTYTSYTFQGMKCVLEETYNHQVKLMGNNIKVLQDIVNCFDDYKPKDGDIWVSETYRGTRFILYDDKKKLEKLYIEKRKDYEELETQYEELKKRNQELYKQMEDIESEEDYEELEKQNKELRKFNSSSIIHLFNKELKKQNEELKIQLKNQNEELRKFNYLLPIEGCYQQTILILISFHIIYYLFI